MAHYEECTDRDLPTFPRYTHKKQMNKIYPLLSTFRANVVFSAKKAYLAQITETLWNMNNNTINNESSTT